MFKETEQEQAINYFVCLFFILTGVITVSKRFKQLQGQLLTTNKKIETLSDNYHKSNDRLQQAEMKVDDLTAQINSIIGSNSLNTTSNKNELSLLNQSTQIDVQETSIDSSIKTNKKQKLKVFQ